MATRMESIKEALSIREMQPGVFAALVLPDYCYGDCESLRPSIARPFTDNPGAWGGLSASLIQTAAAKFTAKDGDNSRHPDVVNMQVQFLRPIVSKEVLILVRVARVTKPIFTVHVAITQDGKECVVGYVNLSDLRRAKGPSFDSKWQLHPRPAPANFAELEKNTSQDWIRYSTPFSKDGWFRLQSLVHFLLPFKSSLPSMSEAWLTPTDPRNTFTNDTLGMLVDLFPPFMENYDPSSSVNHDRLIEIARQQKSNPEGKSELSDTLHRRGWTSPFIITTLSLTLEVKKSLPPQGVKWLFVRAYAKVISQGKYDIEVLVMDENNELVALSHQMALAAVFRAERRDQTMLGARAKV